MKQQKTSFLLLSLLFCPILRQTPLLLLLPMKARNMKKTNGRKRDSGISKPPSSRDLFLHQRNVLLIYRQCENDPFIPAFERSMGVIVAFWLNNPGIN